MKTTIGLISANYTNNNFGPLLQNRTLASLPFGSRYRLVDFPLSNMVNSGITTVGLITPYNYRSLMDHVGVGKPWGLDRKTGGIFILPGATYGVYSMSGKFLQRDILQNRRFLDRDTADYVLFCGSNKVFNMDFEPLIEQHERSGCPITLVYKKTEHAEDYPLGLFLDINDAGAVTGIRRAAEGEANYFLDCFVIDRVFLSYFLDWFKTIPHMDVMEIVMENLDHINADAYCFGGYVGTVDSANDYMRIHQDLLNRDISDELFRSDRMILTKVQDEPPVLYGPRARVKNSIIGTGCIIKGEVENSFIFRNARVERGAVVRNSIIMQHSVICEKASVLNTICDKHVIFGPGVKIEGGIDQPFIVRKDEKL